MKSYPIRQRLEKGEINIIFFGIVAVYLVSKIIMSANTEFIYFEFWILKLYIFVTFIKKTFYP